jgi:translocation and assembly module TamB
VLREKTEQFAMKSRRKPMLSALLIALGLVCVIASGAWGMVQLPAVRTHIRNELRAAIRRELGLDASIDAVRIALPFTLVGEHIVLEHPQHGMLARAERLEVAPSLLALARGKLRLKRILIEKPALRLRVEDGRIVNLPRLAGEPDANENRSLPLRQLVVHEASVELDAAPNYGARLDGVNIVLGVTHGTLLELTAEARSGEFVSMFTAPGATLPTKLREPIQKLALKGRVAPDKIQIDKAEFDSSVLKLEVTHGYLALPLSKGNYSVRILLETELERLKSLPLGVELPAMQGHVALNGSLSGVGKDYRFEGHFHGDNPKLKRFGFGELDLKLEATPSEVKLLKGSQGRIVKQGGLVNIEGRLGLSKSLPLEVSADIQRIEFHKLMDQLGVTDECIVNWVMRGGFKISGTANPVDVSGPIWTDTLHFRALTGAWHDPSSEEVIGTPPGRVTGRVAIRPDALRFENLHGRLPHSELTALVHVGFEDKISVIAKSDKFDLRDATGLMGMSIAGAGGFSLEVGGTYDKTTLTGKLDLNDFALDGYRVGHLRTRANLEKGGVAVRFLETDVRKNDSHYVVDDMLLDFERGFLIDAKAHFEKLALSDFYHSVLLDEDPAFTPYQGHVKGRATVRYTHNFPGDAPDGTLIVGTELDVLDARMHGVAFDSGRIEASWTWLRIDQGTRGARLDVEELRLLRGPGSVIARGKMDVGGALRMTVFAERLSLGQLEPLAGSGLDLAGELGLAGTLRGTLWLPEAQLDLTLLGVRVNKRGLGDGSLKLYATHRDDPWLKRALQIDADEASRDEPCLRARQGVMRANWPGTTMADGTKLPPRATLLCGTAFGGHLSLDLAIGADARMPVRGALDLHEVPASWVLPQANASEAGLLGTVTGHADLIDGVLSDPDSLVGTISLSSLRFGGTKRAWLVSDGPLKVALTGQGLSVERARFSGDGTHLNLKGTASIRHGLALALDGRFDLAVLPSLWPQVVQASGFLDVGVKLSGPADNPSVFGQGKISGASLLTSYYDMPLDKLSAALRFSEHDLLLDDLRAQLAGGEIRAHGSAAILAQSIEHYELFATARDIAVEPIQGVEIAFSADTKLTGGATLRVPELTGSVRLLRAVYKRPFSLGIAERLSGLSQAKRVVRETYDPRKDNIAFDLRLVDSAPIKVANNLLTADFAIEDSERPFRIVGTDQRTGVLGTLSLTRGTMVFRSAQFLIETGTVTFLDETHVRPRLDVQARTEFRRTADTTGARWLISLHAYGEADNLKLDTFSDPALAREDIALLLTVGMTRAEAERLGTSALTQGAALEALASVTGLDREVKKALPVIDDFAVTSAYSLRTNRTEPQVVVGKRLSERVRATATTGLSAESNFKTGVQWRLNNQTSVEAGYDNVQTTASSQFGNIGVDLRWRLEFD